MSRKAAKKHREEMPECSEHPTSPVEDTQTLRRRELDRILAHQGRIELDVDPETLAQLPSSR
jgi:hypothetical protein